MHFYIKAFFVILLITHKFSPLKEIRKHPIKYTL